MSKLLDLMRRLGSDAALAEAYRKDPEAVLRREGLSEEEADALRRKDMEAIKRLTGVPGHLFATNEIIRAYDE